MSSSYIDAISQASTASSSSQSTGTSTKSVMGKEDFLTLLVAQLQNQDPLNPDQPTEFTAQLAQFSSLEQLFSLNDSMNNLVTSNSNADRLSTLGTIGKEVVYSSSNFSFTGDPVQVGYQLDGTASSVKVSVQLNGQTVRTLTGKELTAGNHYLTWDGLTEAGEAAPVGDYKLVLQANAGTNETISATPLIRSEVTGVDLEGDYGGTLITKAGQVAFNTIYGVYDPSDTTSNDTASTSTDDTTTSGVADVVDSVAETATAVDDAAKTITN